MSHLGSIKADFDLPAGDFRDAWAYRPVSAAEVRCAWSSGRLAWGFEGLEAECPYPESHPLKKAWGMGYNDARKLTTRDEVDVVRHFRSRGELNG